jgi:hypothetical protein
MIVTVSVTMIVTMVVTLTKFLAVIAKYCMTVGLHLYFRVVGWGKERGL